MTTPTKADAEISAALLALDTPSMWAVARRPRWIGALVLALMLAVGFAALSQWQLSRSVSTGTVVPRDTEDARPLSSVAKPQAPVTDAATAQIVSATGTWHADDYVLMSDRVQRGTTGWWVVGHFSADRPGGGVAGLAVAVGWSATEKGATSALSRLESTSGGTQVVGRYFPSEGPQDSDFEHNRITALAPGAMINLWNTVDPAGVYGGYLVSATAAKGLTAIDSPPPDESVQLNLLNVFYAAEWVVFAGFAIFLWYRLVKDAWERERDELAELAEVN